MKSRCRSLILDCRLVLTTPLLFLKTFFMVRNIYSLVQIREISRFFNKVLSELILDFKLQKYRKLSEGGYLFSRKDLVSINKLNIGPNEIVANNEYLAGGGLLTSSKEAIRNFDAYRKVVEENFGCERIYFGPDWVSAIGHITALSTIAKLPGDNLYNKRRKTILYTHAANHFYLSLFRNHFDLIRYPETLKSASVSYLRELLHPLNAASIGNKSIPYYEAMTLAERFWNERQDIEKNFLELPQDVVQRGNDFLARLGMSGDQEFVAIHLREAPATAFRGGGNVDLLPYLPMIRKLQELDYFVIRLGNFGMTKLETISNDTQIGSRYYDYANSLDKCEELDIFLMAKCSFLVGTSSGPIFVPKDFNTPVLYTNAPNIGVLPGVLGYSLPNLYFDTNRKVNLTLSEMLSIARVGWKLTTSPNGFIRIPNNEADLIQAVEFMHNHGKNRKHTDTLDELNLISNTLRREYSLSSTMPISPTFLDRHQVLLK